MARSSLLSTPYSEVPGLRFSNAPRHLAFQEALSIVVVVAFQEALSIVVVVGGVLHPVALLSIPRSFPAIFLYSSRIPR